MLISTKYNCFKEKFYNFLNLLNTFNYKEFIIFRTHNSCNSPQMSIKLTSHYTDNYQSNGSHHYNQFKVEVHAVHTSNFHTVAPIFSTLTAVPPSPTYKNVYQFTCIKHQVQAQDNKEVFNMSLQKSGSSVRNLCYIIFLQPRIWRGFLDICKICGPVI